MHAPALLLAHVCLVKRANYIYSQPKCKWQSSENLAETVNMPFISVGLELAENIASSKATIHLSTSNQMIQLPLSYKPVTSSQVLKCLKQLKNGKACGPDKIPTTLVKDAVNLISYPLTLIYNSSMKNSIFPDYWKATQVAPIFKCGIRCDSNNYRPISVPSIFSRVFEMIVQNQLHEFLKVNCIITNN